GFCRCGRLNRSLATPTRRGSAAEASLAMPPGGHAGFAGVAVCPAGAAVKTAAPAGNPVATTKTVSVRDVDGLNAGFARVLLEQYLENPEAVPAEWRTLFESGASELVATHPGLARLLELLAH